MLAVDLLAWTPHLLLEGHLAKAEPKALRYRLLHAAAPADNDGSGCASSTAGPGPRDLAAAFARLHALPVPAG